MNEKTSYSKFYFLFLSSLMALILISQLVVHLSLNDQELGGTEVNIASRQKALIANITLKALEIQRKIDAEDLADNQLKELAVLRQKWNDSHQGLVYGNQTYQLDGNNSVEIEALFKEITPEFIKLSKAIGAVIGYTSGTDISTEIDIISNGNEAYIKTMNKIIYQYILENKRGVQRAKMIGWGLTLLTLVALILSFMMFIRPLFKKSQLQNEELKDLNKNLEESSRIKSNFLANMSHEIRTPMHGVIGMAGLLKKTKLEPDQLDYVQTIQSSSENLLLIINDILDYSKMEAGKMEIHMAPIQLSKSIEEVIDLLKPYAYEKGLELIFYVDPAVPTSVSTDGHRLKQILINLVNNAIKFTEKGEVMIEVSVVNTDQNLTQLLFNVKDTGIGIERGTISQLFHSFTQADSSNTRRYQGTGLGLAICKEIVNLMGGRIWVESELGKGSTFHFTLVAETIEEFGTETEQIGALKGLKAVIIDDNMTNLKILVKQLANWGVQATPFNDPSLVLEILDNLQRFDFCLLDMQMPGIDGKALTRKIREKFTNEELPVIVLSSVGRSLMEDDEGLYTQYLTKPIKPDVLRATVLKAMSIGGKELVTDSLAQGNHTGNFVMNRGLRILIAEDNELQQAVTTKTLKLLGYDSDHALSSVEVIEKINRSQFDLILMGTDTSGIDGVGTSKRIKSMFGSNEAPVIIGLAETDKKAEREQCIKGGMDDVVPKPLSLELLAERINYWFPPQE